MTRGRDTVHWFDSECDGKPLVKPGTDFSHVDFADEFRSVLLLRPSLYFMNERMHEAAAVSCAAVTF